MYVPCNPYAHYVMNDVERALTNFYQFRVSSVYSNIRIILKLCVHFQVVKSRYIYVLNVKTDDMV